MNEPEFVNRYQIVEIFTDERGLEYTKVGTPTFCHAYGLPIRYCRPSDCPVCNQ